LSENEREIMFFTFDQNNSGGVHKPPAIYVIVEAKDHEDANNRAEEHSLYFNGCDSDIDCSCCGDRWYRQWSSEKGDDVPSVYGEPLTDSPNVKYDWSTETIPHAIVYFMDGT
jgi:hypothetical protein